MEDPTVQLSFDEFYRQHRNEIGRALCFTLGDQSLGQEAVDEAMARACQRWGQLSGTENPAGWVYVVGRRWGLSWRTRRFRERAREEKVATDFSASAASSEDVLDLLEALKDLSTDQRTVVACRFSLGLSVRETAQLLGIREGTVKSRLARAVDQLRVILEGSE